MGNSGGRPGLIPFVFLNCPLQQKTLFSLDIICLPRNEKKRTEIIILTLARHGIQFN